MTEPPPRKMPIERRQQIERLRQDPERYADQFFAVIAPFVEGKLKEMQLLRTTASAGRQLRSVSVGHERRRQSNLNSAES